MLANWSTSKFFQHRKVRLVNRCSPYMKRPVAYLPDIHIKQLYAHQVSALNASRRGQDLVVVTGTASGKTLAYNLPILDTVFADRDALALHLFPTKALAQDQLKGLLEIIAGDALWMSAVRPGVYDGDTPISQRHRIRNEANLVLSNPDMLHAAIFPYHPKWSTFFSGLRYIVIDEVHMYRGILGTHVSAVLHRLQRICEQLRFSTHLSRHQRHDCQSR
jgi:DEAD/DEAH box helicase domain-containing protein